MRSIREQYESNRDYLEETGLGEVIDFAGSNLDYIEGIHDGVRGEVDGAFPPEADDLVRLHRMVRSRRSFTVMEFGLGYSTLALAHALWMNKNDWATLDPAPEIRNRFPFKLFSVETSAEWIADFNARVPASLKEVIDVRHSTASIGTYRDQICTYYDQLPDVVADFYYLDGPWAKDVQGDVNGMTFHCEERTIMAADLLRMEPILIPGTFIVVDGRTNNARFLERNFTRSFQSRWDREADITTFELDEPRLGMYNRLGTDYFD